MLLTIFGWFTLVMLKTYNNSLYNKDRWSVEPMKAFYASFIIDYCPHVNLIDDLIIGNIFGLVYFLATVIIIIISCTFTCETIKPFLNILETFWYNIQYAWNSTCHYSLVSAFLRYIEQKFDQVNEHLRKLDGISDKMKPTWKHFVISTCQVAHSKFSSNECVSWVVMYYTIFRKFNENRVYVCTE